MNSAEQTTLIPIAQDVLNKLDEVAKAARTWLNDSRSLSADSLVPGSKNDAAVRNVAKVNRENRAAYQRLSKEPVVSRVVAKDEAGKLHTYFFCRADQGMAECGVISYLTPVAQSLLNHKPGESVQFEMEGTVKHYRIEAIEVCPPLAVPA